MKYTHLNAFKKHVQDSIPDLLSDIYLILAKEEYIRRQAIDCLIRSSLPEVKSLEMSVQVFDAAEYTANSILQELETLNFFVKKRIVVVHHVDHFDKASTLKFEAYFAKPNRSVMLILAAETLKSTMTFYKRAEKAGVVFDVPEEKPWEKEKSLTEWVLQEAFASQKQMSPSTALSFVKRIGHDQSLLYQELKKLFCYIGDRPAIQTLDIEAICTTTQMDTGWQLGEAVFQKNTGEALRMARGILAEGAAFIALLRQLRSQFQTQVLISSILKNGGTAADVALEFPYMKGAILDKNIRQSQGYGMDPLRQGLLMIDQTELAAKSTGANIEFLADMLMVKLTKF